MRLVDIPKSILLAALVAAYRAKGYVLLDGVDRANLFGVRAAGGATNTFNDLVGVVSQHEDGTRYVDPYAATTDPGAYWLANPARVEGTAILVPGQYRDSHAIGLHAGKYKALVQVRAMRFYRDKNRDSVYDFDPATIVEDRIGCNIHKANVGSGRVEKWSAACQVIYGEKPFELFLERIDRHIALAWEKTFSYTLFEESDLDFGKAFGESEPTA